MNSLGEMKGRLEPFMFEMLGESITVCWVDPFEWSSRAFHFTWVSLIGAGWDWFLFSNVIRVDITTSSIAPSV